ncbi:MAG: hypothetical protein ABGX26_01940 [Nautiliaceae bacterium]
MNLEKLFKAWEKTYNEKGINATFVKDGIVDKDKYQDVVWILKDTNDYSKPINELIKRVVEENNKKSGLWKGITWHNVGRATAKLLNPNITFSEAEKQRKKSLLNIAVLNLKKIKAKSKVSNKTMRNFVEGYEEFIIKELELLKPKIVVLGGTFYFVKDILKLKNKEKNIYKSELFPNVTFIKAYHPGARIKKRKYLELF